MSSPPLDTSPKRHRRDAVRESLAGDSLDSHPIPVAQTRARTHFPNFFSWAIPRPSSTATKPMWCCSRVLWRLDAAPRCNRRRRKTPYRIAVSSIYQILGDVARAPQAKIARDFEQPSALAPQVVSKGARTRFVKWK
jgi:hypothetical protein